MFPDLRHKIRTIVREESRSMYTLLHTIVEDIDEELLEARLSRKDDEEILQDKTPIASMYAGDGYGELHPIDLPEEWMMHVSDIPTDELTERGHIDVEKQRSHSMQDGMLGFRRWFEADEIPERESLLDYLYHHHSDTKKWIYADGEWQIEHHAGNLTGVDDGAIYDEHTAGHTATLEADGRHVHISRSGGPDIDLDITESGYELSVPDEETDRPNRFNRVEVTADGSIVFDGAADFGDQEAVRVDRENDDEEILDEPAAPIVDPTDDAETQYDNPAGATMHGPMDNRLFETRGLVLERREEDPDPAVTDETDPAFIELEHIEEELGERRIPVGYTFWHEVDEELKIWTPAEEAETIFP